jgi:predicted DNA-binding WGR domain protein
MSKAKQVRKKRPAELNSAAFKDRSRHQQEVMKLSHAACSRIKGVRREFLLDIADNQWAARWDATESQFNKELRRWDSIRKRFLREAQDPVELHFFSCNWNGDRGPSALKHLISNAGCDAGTALRLYWLNDPYYYREYTSIGDSSGEEREWLQLLRGIERRFRRNDFATSKIPFDPTPWVTEQDEEAVAHKIPGVMFKPVAAKGPKQSAMVRKTPQLAVAFRELFFQEGTSNKFWKIQLDGSAHTVIFGRIGTEGQHQTKEFDNDAAARKSFDKLVAEKLKKGYVDSASGKKSTAASAKQTTKAVSKPKSTAQPKGFDAGVYDDVIAFLERVEDPKKRQMNARKRLTARQVEKLRRQFPGVPEDFLAYLLQVGEGAFRECQFAVRGDLVTPDELFGEGVFFRQDPTTRVLCFGDNFSGDMSGFLPEKRWSIVELWHDDGTLYPVKKPFGKYIREEMLMGPKGKDLRVKRESHSKHA